MTVPITLRRLAARILQYGALLFWSLFALIPIVWIISTSLKDRVDIFTFPPKFFFSPSFEAYKKFLLPGPASILRILTNSAIVAVGTVVFTLILASLAAYAFSRYRFRGRKELLFSMMATRLLPPITAVIPLFLMMNDLGFIDTRRVLIIIYTALNIPFATWMMKSFFDAVPKELEESARIDGCSSLGALARITVPLAAPGFAATSIFVFILAWNEFLFAFIFTSVEARTVPVIIPETVGEFQIFWQDMATLATLLMIPTIGFAIFAQRHLVKGLTTGALK